MSELLPTTQYEKLLGDLTELYEETVLYGDRQQHRAKVASFWQMGRRIIDEVQHGKMGAEYGKQVIRRVSEDMTRKYGPGMGLRTINYIRSFAAAYTRREIDTPLTWSHYKILLSVHDDTTRKRLTAQAIEEGLSKQQLMQRVRDARSPGDADPVAFPLAPREATAGIFKVVLKGDPDDSGGETLLLDLGFGVLRRERVKGLRNVQDGQFVRLVDERRHTFEPVSCAVGNRYRYRGTLLRVVDGDTVKMRIQLGFGSYLDQTMRLRGVDAMEWGTPEGDRATAALRRMLKSSRTIDVFTYSSDRYGRYIADLVVDEHKYINKLLVEKGFARFLNMRLS